MSQLFGNEAVKMYLGATEYTLRLADRGNRFEDFEKEIKSWYDLDRVRQQRTKGYRLKARYKYRLLTTSQVQTLIDADNWEGDIFLKFSTLPVKFQVHIISFRRGLSDGLNDYDEVEIEFIGIKLVRKYPNPDLYYFMPPCFNGFGWINQVPVSNPEGTHEYI